MLIFFSATGKIYREFSQPSLQFNNISVFTDVSWNPTSNKARLGFIIILNSGLILTAGSLGLKHFFPVNT